MDYYLDLDFRRLNMMNYRDYTLELVDMGYNADDMLVACLKYMSQDDVKDMLICNELLLDEEYA